MIGHLNSYTATHALIWISAYGLPWAEISLDVEATLTGAVTLTVADLAMSMTVVSGGPDVGRSHYRLVGGAGGWSSTIAAKGYANDAGVKASTVLQDAATAAGETFAETLPTTRVGDHYTREAGPASQVLHELYPRAWYVGADGLTYLGTRAASTLSTLYTPGPVDLARGTVTLAADAIAGIVPGLEIEGVTVADVMHEMTPDRLRSHVWGTALGSTSRRADAMRAIVDQLLPDLPYRGLTEYRIVLQSGDRLDLQVVRTSSGLSDQRRVRVRPGLPGCKASHYLGSRVLVAFVDADPARPVVVSFEDAEITGFVAPLLKLAGGGLPVARDTDPVLAGYLLYDAPLVYYRGGLLDPWVAIPPPATPGVRLVSDLGVALAGTITDGSAIAECG